MQVSFTDYSCALPLNRLLSARKFHELNQAYELLLDPLRRMALDAKQRLKEARKARYSQYDAKRKNMVDDLEAREQAFKKARVEKEEKQQQIWRDNEQVMEQGRKLREDKEREMQRREEEVLRSTKERRNELEPPTLGVCSSFPDRARYTHPSVGTLDTTIKLKWSLASRPSLTKPEDLSSLLAPFGATETSDIVISLKPPPPKKAKRGTALVPFKQIGDAFAAVCSSGTAARGLQDVEVSWAEGNEPELIDWLKKMGKLGSTQLSVPSTAATSPPPATPSFNAPVAAATPLASSSPFSSFRTTFVSFPLLTQQ